MGGVFLITYRWKKIYEEYTKVVIGDVLNDEVIFAETNRGVIRLETVLGKKINILFAENRNYPKPCICDNISKGDSIIKRSQSDTIKVKRRDSVYIFLLGATIEKTK
jgi:hypothetical protein